MTQPSPAALADSIDPDRLAPVPEDPTVADVMRDEVVFCLPSTPIDAVAKLMADNDLVEIPVLLDRRPVGFVAAGDIVDRLIDGDVVVTGSDFAMRPPVTKVLASDLMRTPLVLVDEAQRLTEVVPAMRGQGRHLMLVMHDDERPVGMVTAREIADFLLARAAHG